MMALSDYQRKLIADSAAGVPLEPSPPEERLRAALAPHMTRDRTYVHAPADAVIEAVLALSPPEAMPGEEAIARAICNGADRHLRCTYPDCGCRTMGGSARAVLALLPRHEADKRFEIYERDEKGVRVEHVDDLRDSEIARDLNSTRCEAGGEMIERLIQSMVGLLGKFERCAAGHGNGPDVIADATAEFREAITNARALSPSDGGEWNDDEFNKAI